MYNKMVMVLAPCRRDMVTDLSYRMVKVIAPCRRVMLPDIVQDGCGGGFPQQHIFLKFQVTAAGSNNTW